MARILVVDDQSIITLQLEESLTASGYEVVGTANSGEKAVEMANRLNPELILMDIVMPGKLDGIEAAEIIKADLDIPVVFLTAYSEEQLIQRAKQVEPYGYILKPFQMSEVIAAIEVANHKIQIERRLRESEEALRKTHAELEHRVEERTAELATLNRELKQEIGERKQIEKELRKREAELETQTKELEELNSALKVLLQRRDEDRKELEESVLVNVKQLVLPYLEKLKKDQREPHQVTLFGIIESHLEDIVSPFAAKLSAKYSKLSPTEVKISNLIKDGRTTKEIAELLNLSENTVKAHRYRVRSKLDLKNKRMNLRSYLQSFAD